MGDGHRVPRTIRFSRVFEQSGCQVVVASGAPTSENYIQVQKPLVARDAVGRRLQRYSHFAAFIPDVLGIRDALHVRRYGLAGFRELLKSHAFDILLVQDLAMLPIAVRHRKSARVIFDAREYYPTQNEESSIFNRFERPDRIRICRKYLPRADLIIATSRGHADAYTEAFGVHPEIILSASAYEEIEPAPLSFENVRLVHHGVTNRNRQLSKLIDLMGLLREEFTLDFFLVAHDPHRLDELKQRAKGNPRIRFNDPVPFDRIVPTLSKFDVGISYFEPTTFNLLHTVPNKIFEYVQARLAVCIGPSPSMRKVLTPFDCAIVAEEFNLESLATALNSLTREQIFAMKQRSDLAARQLTEENEGKKLLALISRLFESSDRR